MCNFNITKITNEDKRYVFLTNYSRMKSGRMLFFYPSKDFGKISTKLFLMPTY